MVVVPNEGEQVLAEGGFNQAFTLRLFSNDYAPDDAATATSFTELSGGGYASRSLVYLNATITPGDPTAVVYPLERFIFNGAITCYGYYVTRNSDGKIVWTDRLPTPFVTDAAGGVLDIVPRCTLS